METETKPLIKSDTNPIKTGQKTTHEIVVTMEEPDEIFWAKYQTLWEDSYERSPFQGPTFIQNLIKIAKGKTEGIQFYCQNELLGCAILNNDGHCFRFLSDKKSDYNSFVFNQNLSSVQLEACFKAFFRFVESEKLSILLHKQIEGAIYTQALQQSMAESNAFVREVPYSICPILECESPELMFEKMNRSKNVRYKRNRLLKMKETYLEILEDDKHLEDWCQAYCNHHVERWTDSATPSKYTSAHERKHLINHVKSWIEDGTLVRFAIVQEKQRIALSAGLLCRDTFVGHLQSFDPAYKKHSLGNILINLIGKWLMDRGIRKINFGDGKDEYKFSFATDSLRLTNIYISPPQNLPFRFKAYLDATYRSNANIRRIVSLTKSTLRFRKINQS